MNQEDTLVDRTIEEIVKTAIKRGQIGEPMDCGEALRIYWEVYRDSNVKGSRIDYARDTMRDYMWFDERPTKEGKR